MEQVLESFRVAPKTLKSYVSAIGKLLAFFAFSANEMARWKTAKLSGDVTNWVNFFGYLVKDKYQNYDNITMWTKEFCGKVAERSKSGGGKSQLDNASAACTFFLVNAGLVNPFTFPSVMNVRKAIARITSLVGHTKNKAQAPNPHEASDLTAAAAKLALDKGSTTVVDYFRFIMVMTMTSPRWERRTRSTSRSPRLTYWGLAVVLTCPCTHKSTTSTLIPVSCFLFGCSFAGPSSRGT